MTMHDESMLHYDPSRWSICKRCDGDGLGELKGSGRVVCPVCCGAGKVETIVIPPASAVPSGGQSIPPYATCEVCGLSWSGYWNTCPGCAATLRSDLLARQANQMAQACELLRQGVTGDRPAQDWGGEATPISPDAGERPAPAHPKCRHKDDPNHICPLDQPPDPDYGFESTSEAYGKGFELGKALYADRNRLTAPRLTCLCGDSFATHREMYEHLDMVHEDEMRPPCTCPDAGLNPECPTHGLIIRPPQ